MAYIRSNLISRRGYSGFGGIADDIGGFAKSVLSAYGSQQQQAGALTQAQIDTQAALAAKQGNGGIAGTGIDTTTVAIVGGVGLAAYLLLRRRKTT